MRENKFRAFDHFNDEMFSMEKLSIFFHEVEIRRKGGNKITVMEWAGLADKNGKEIFEGDVLNVFFTSHNGEHNHDLLYEVKLSVSKGIELSFIKLLWESYGHNQYTFYTTLSFVNRSLCDGFRKEGYVDLAVADSHGENHLLSHKWKENDYSNYIEKVGNIFEQCDLLKVKA